MTEFALRDLNLMSPNIPLEAPKKIIFLLNENQVRLGLNKRDLSLGYISGLIDNICSIPKSSETLSNTTVQQRKRYYKFLYRTLGWEIKGRHTDPKSQNIARLIDYFMFGESNFIRNSKGTKYCSQKYSIELTIEILKTLKMIQQSKLESLEKVYDSQWFNTYRAAHNLFKKHKRVSIAGLPFNSKVWSWKHK